MRDFERKLITEWRRLGLPFSESTIVIAVSGGADSLSLLLAADELRKLKKLDLRIVAVHFNHRLRGDESNEDEEFVRQITVDRDIELAIGHSGSAIKTNIEQNARHERYDFLRRAAENVHAHAILIAHTVDDQAETFLLNLIRGSGARGLSGMPAVRKIEDSEAVIARPLLSWARRRDTEGYCHELAVKYRSDTMNEDESFTRVRVRKILLPLLADFNPKIVEHLAETANLLRVELPPEPEVSGEGLRLDDLRRLKEADLKRTIRAWLETNRGHLRQVGLKHVTAIERLIGSGKSGKTVELPGGDAVFKQGGWLCFGKNMVEKRGLAN
jgi:tRNA(Ile)-lysidine synthase